MASIDKEMIQKQLNKSIEILEMTFDKFNLQVIGYGFCGIQENNGWMPLKQIFMMKIAQLFFQTIIL